MGTKNMSNENETVGAPVEAIEAIETTEATAKEAKAAKVLPESAIYLQTMPKGKSFEVYDLGDYRIFDLAIPGEKAAAIASMEHIVMCESDAKLGGYELYLDNRAEDIEALNAGSIVFDGKTLGNKDDAVLAYISITFVPEMDAFYTSAHELTRRRLQKLLAEFVGGITRKHLKVDDDGKLVIKDAIPIDPKDILSTGARVSSKDPYIWLLLAVAQIKLSDKVKIRTAELRMCLTSSNYAKNSAFRSLEETGVFMETLAAVRKMLSQTTDANFMARTVSVLQKTETKRADEITADFIKSWRDSAQVDRIIADRDITEVKRKAAEKITDTEKEALGALFGE
jgi:hypothetical protein